MSWCPCTHLVHSTVRGRHQLHLCCSGKFPPIPAHYSSDLRELVEALIKKEPEARPSLQEILDLAYVRRHMGLYRDHIARHITERQTSFQRSLSQFNLEAIVQVWLPCLLVQQSPRCEDRPT